MVEPLEHEWQTVLLNLPDDLAALVAALRVAQAGIWCLRQFSKLRRRGTSAAAADESPGRSAPERNPPEDDGDARGGEQGQRPWGRVR